MINDDLLYRVACSYHIEKKNQREIAAQLGVSRVQVSKYLKMAASRGLVRVEVIPPSISSSDQSFFRGQFLSRFPMKQILVCPSYNSRDTLFRTLLRHSEDFLFSVLGSTDMVIGLGWGRTVYELTENMRPVERSLWRVVPLAGGSNRASEKYFNTNHIVQTFSEKLGAQSELIYLPLISDSTESRRSILQGDEYDRISKLWSSLDVTICSVGSNLTGSPLFRYGVIGPEYLEILSRSRAVGDMLTHFYDVEGNIVEIGIEDRMINVSLAQLRNTKNRVVIASGSDKSSAILGGLRAGLIDILVIDQSTAASVLSLSEQRADGGRPR